jgi:hypothetical protein
MSNDHGHARGIGSTETLANKDVLPALPAFRDLLQVNNAEPGLHLPSRCFRRQSGVKCRLVPVSFLPMCHLKYSLLEYSADVRLKPIYLLHMSLSFG